MKFQFTEKKSACPRAFMPTTEKKVMKLERFFRDDAEATCYLPSVEEGSQ